MNSSLPRLIRVLVLSKGKNLFQSEECTMNWIFRPRDYNVKSGRASDENIIYVTDVEYSSLHQWPSLNTVEIDDG